jgi:hypothetical protein
MDIGSIGTAHTSAWYNQASGPPAVEQTNSAQPSTEMQLTSSQSNAQPAGDLYNWQGTVVDAFA